MQNLYANPKRTAKSINLPLIYLPRIIGIILIPSFVMQLAQSVYFPVAFVDSAYPPDGAHLDFDDRCVASSVSGIGQAEEQIPCWRIDGEEFNRAVVRHAGGRATAALTSALPCRLVSV